MPWTAEQKRAQYARILDGGISDSETSAFNERLGATVGSNQCRVWAGTFNGHDDRGQHLQRPYLFGMPAARVAWLVRYRPDAWPERHDAAHLCQRGWCVNAVHVIPVEDDDWHRNYDREDRNSDVDPFAGQGLLPNHQNLQLIERNVTRV